MPYPHLTVAVVCIQESRILMVNEIDNGINCWNQPAGHVEVGESLLDAAIRETLEETGYQISLTGVLGIYQGLHVTTGTHYIRVCFMANALTKVTNKLDNDIIEAQWLKLDDLLAGKYQLRSDLARQTLEDSMSAPIYPLNLISHFFNSGVTK